jgi:hypothetical protein
MAANPGKNPSLQLPNSFSKKIVGSGTCTQTDAAAAAILIANFFLFSARDLLLLLLLLCASTLRGYEGVPLRGQPNVCPRCLGSFFFFFFFEKEQNRIYF